MMLTFLFSVSSASPKPCTGAAGTRPTVARTVSRLTGPGNTSASASGPCEEERQRLERSRDRGVSGLGKIPSFLAS